MVFTWLALFRKAILSPWLGVPTLTIANHIAERNRIDKREKRLAPTFENMQIAT
jgi:hypothetical protein